MTLLVTEIRARPQPMIVFAADRRISTPSGRRVAERPKIFKVPGKRAAIGYFGLAQVGRQRMDKWLGDFLQAQAAVATLGELAKSLADELNRAVPRAERVRYPSGLHMAGLRPDNAAEFWFIRNVEDDRTTVTGNYAEREDYQRRDAARLSSSAVQIYRNGDLPAHVAAWEGMDKLFEGVLALPNFSPGKGPDAYARWVRFKMEVIAHFYQRFSRLSIIGKPIDTLVVTQQGVREPRL